MCAGARINYTCFGEGTVVRNPSTVVTCVPCLAAGYHTSAALHPADDPPHLPLHSAHIPLENRKYHFSIFEAPFLVSRLDCTRDTRFSFRSLHTTAALNHRFRGFEGSAAGG